MARPSTLIQVATTCDHWHGTLQHALAIVRALKRLPASVQLASLRPPALAAVRRVMDSESIRIVEATPESVPDADCTIIAGLWDEPCAEAARRLLHDEKEVVLVPTVYWRQDLLGECAPPAKMLWYVSWDQAMEARPWWRHARRVEVVRCAVDPERFRPLDAPVHKPWVLCRHSRDTPEKFALDVAALPGRLGRPDVLFDILGAANTIGNSPDARIRVRPEGSIDADIFLPNAHLWVYAHACWWRETACIAMLEAMACGLPAIVTAAGGMREYLVHGRTGFTCSRPEEFIDFITLLLDNQDLLHWMSEQARQWILEHHSIEALAGRLRRLL